MLLLRTLLFLALVIGIANVAQAQSETSARRKQASSSSRRNPDRSRGSRDPGIMLGTLEAEMLVRQDLKAAEKDYQENLDRAREAAQLSLEIRDTYLHNKAFGRNEQKKLERLEKITRKIRSEAGGSNGDVMLEDTPTQIEHALARLAEVSEKMRKVVEKTPRQVVSTSVIERANEMLEIIHYIHTFTR